MKKFAKTANESGINTPIMEWKGYFSFWETSVDTQRYAQTKNEIRSSREPAPERKELAHFLFDLSTCI